MKVLILGGTGAMGKHLVDILSQKDGVNIFVTSRKPHEKVGNVSFLQGNAHDSAFLYSLLNEKFDVIIDFMAYSTSEFACRYKRIMASCGHYIFLSSSRVYAASDKPITEDSPRLLDVITDKKYLSTDEYALAKARQEDLLMKSDCTNYTIVRPYITYSETRLQLGVLEKEGWLYRALHGRSIVFSDDIAHNFTTLTYGLDVAHGISALIGRAEAQQEAFHITSINPICWKEVLSIYLNVLEEKTGRCPEVLMTENSLNLKFRMLKYQVLYDRLYNRSFDNSKIGRFVDVKAFVKPQDGLRSCLTFFLQNGSFSVINNWGSEAKADKLTKTSTSLSEIASVKQKIKYFTYRYCLPL